MAQRTRREIARIGIDLLSEFLLALIELSEIVDSHVDLASNHETGGHLAPVKPQRKFADGAEVVVDILTDPTVPPCRAERKLPILIV